MTGAGSGRSNAERRRRGRGRRRELARDPDGLDLELERFRLRAPVLVGAEKPRAVAIDDVHIFAFGAFVRRVVVILLV